MWLGVWGRFTTQRQAASIITSARRPCATTVRPLSAAGLVWRHYGETAVRALLRPVGAVHLATTIAAAINCEVVRRIDEIDNGIGQPGDALDLSSLLDDFNPPWDSPEIGDRMAEDAAYSQAANKASSGGAWRPRWRASLPMRWS